jgi:hypothetical protein
MTTAATCPKVAIWRTFSITLILEKAQSNGLAIVLIQAIFAITLYYLVAIPLETVACVASLLATLSDTALICQMMFRLANSRLRIA